MNKTISKESFIPPLWMISVAVMTLFFWLVFQLKEIVVLLVVGYSIAYILNPILVWLQNKKISRGMGVLIVILGLLVVLSLVAVTALPTIAQQIDALLQHLPHYIEIARERSLPLLDKVRGFILEKTGADIGPIDFGILSNFGGDTVKPIVSGVLATLLQGYSITLTLANLVLLPFIVFYLAIDFEKIHSNFLYLFPKSKRKGVLALTHEIDRYVSAFVRGQALVCTILFVLYAIGLGVVGIDLWFLMAMIAGFGNAIPYFGFLSGIVLSSIMALVTFGDFSHILQVLGVFGVIQLLEGFVITPRVMGEKVGFSPLMIILAIFIGGKLFGLLGIFLAIPGTAVVKVLASHFHEWVLKRGNV